jgi:predicted dienelactone hydrolase
LYWPDASVLSASSIALAGTESRAFENAPLSGRPKRLFVILFSAGAGVPASLYTVLLEDLASHGYLVIGVDAPYESLGVVTPDGRDLRYDEQKVDDVLAFAKERIQQRSLDLLYLAEHVERLPFDVSRIDHGRLGVIGHSRGGLAAAEACKLSPKFKGCINMDGNVLGGPWYQDGKAPYGTFLMLRRSREEPSDDQLKQWNTSREAWNAIDARARAQLALAPGGGWRITLQNATHSTFSDTPLLGCEVRSDLKERTEAAQILRRTLNSFFDRYLCDISVPELSHTLRDVSRIELEHMR